MIAAVIARAPIDLVDVGNAMQDGRGMADQTPHNGFWVYMIVVLGIITLWQKVKS